MLRLRSLAKRVLPRPARLTARQAYYFGNRFECPICGSKVRLLYDAGVDVPVLRQLDVKGSFRKEDTCPVCWSHARTRLIHAYIEREIDWSQPSAPKHVLHFAPEIDISRLLRSKAGEYIPTDLEPERYPEAEGIVPADITALPWPAQSFDLVVCNHVLEHVSDDSQAMAEIFRVLRPGGMAMLQVPFATQLEATIEDPGALSAAERERRFGQVDHVRIYGRDYTDRLSRAGFEVDVFDPEQAWGAAEVARLRLEPGENIFLAKKRLD